MKKFKLEIELGNDTMMTSEDVSAAINRSICRLYTYAMTVGAAGRIRDTNGNKVGSWVVEGDEEEEEEET